MAAKQKKQTEPEAVNVQPRLSASEDVVVSYSNFAEVTHSMHNFGLSFGRVPPKLSDDQMHEVKNSGTLTLEASVQVILPPTVIPALIEALQRQYERYQDSFGNSSDEGTSDE